MNIDVSFGEWRNTPADEDIRAVLKPGLEAADKNLLSTIERRTHGEMMSNRSCVFAKQTTFPLTVEAAQITRGVGCPQTGVESL